MTYHHRRTDAVVFIGLAGAAAATLLGLNPPSMPHYATVGELVTWQPPEPADSSGDEHRTPQPAPRIVPEFTEGGPVKFTLGWFVVRWGEDENATDSSTSG